jgi:superfamily II DNA/RNA helicase
LTDIVSAPAASDDTYHAAYDDAELPLPDAADAGDSGAALPDVPVPEPEAPGFDGLGLSPEILRAVAEMGYKQPTPIQAQAIPVVLMGRDVLGCAQTGTGKTAGFTLPMMDILSGSRARARMPRSLILEPTRELALQVAENFVQYGKHQKLNHALLIGGESLSDQREALMRGVDVLIATPGRLMDLFERGGLLLTDVRILVIDEADRMLDMGFIPDVEKIVAMLPRTRQTLFFSATMAPEIRRLADAFLQNPREITVSRPASVATTIVAGLALVAETDKREALRRLIRTEDVQNALIFCNRKRDVDILYKSLKRHGFSVGALHGDMSQPERFATLGKFKAGELRLLVCSDVAARGLDIGGLSHVFNFDVPIHAEDYVHRIGRTGRAGLEGHAYTLATPDDRAFVEAIETLVGAPISRVPVSGLDVVEWSEGKPRRGRGRASAKTSEPATEKRAAKPRDEKRRDERPRREKTTVEKPAGEEQPRARRRDAVPDAAQEQPAERPRRDAAERGPRRAEGDRAPQRAASERAQRPEDDRRTYRQDDDRRGYRRDDLGPSVVGFGDDVPAFMMLRAPVRKAPKPVPEEAA